MFDYLLNYTRLKASSTTSILGTIFLFFALPINFFESRNNLIVSGVCSSSLYPSFILNPNLLLILLIQTLIGGIVVYDLCFLWCTQYNLEYLKQNKNHLVIQIHHSKLELVFLVYCFYTVSLYFSTCNKWITLEVQHVYLNFLSLLFVNSHKQIYVIHLFSCFQCSWMLLPC